MKKLYNEIRGFIWDEISIQVGSRVKTKDTHQIWSKIGLPVWNKTIPTIVEMVKQNIFEDLKNGQSNVHR